jgi:hypothetical protein
MQRLRLIATSLQATEAPSSSDNVPFPALGETPPRHGDASLHCTGSLTILVSGSTDKPPLSFLETVNHAPISRKLFQVASRRNEPRAWWSRRSTNAGSVGVPCVRYRTYNLSRRNWFLGSCTWYHWALDVLRFDRRPVAANSHIPERLKAWERRA